jgi:hypothetical protein
MTAYRDQSEVIFPVVQTAHGFSPGQALRRDTTAWVKALADTSANGSMVGVVDRVINANTFYLRLTGKITGLSGLSAGTTYYLSTTTPGALSPTAPSTVGQLYRPVLVADSATSGYVYNDAGMVVGTGPPGPPGPIGDITTSPIWDAKGDLAVGTGPDTSARLAVGPQGYYLVSDSAQTAGLGWGRPLYHLDIVKELGANNTGSVDAAPQINQAIVNLASTGGIVQLGNNHRINSPINFSPCVSTWKAVTLRGVGGTFNYNNPGATTILSYTGTSAIKAIGTDLNNYPYVNLEGFCVRVMANQGTGVPCIDFQAVVEGFFIKQVEIDFASSGGVPFTGDGFRVTIALSCWTFENCRVASAIPKTEGIAWSLTDGRNIAGSSVNGALGTVQCGNGTLTSCQATYLPHGYDILGDVTSLSFNGCAAIAGGHPSLGATGIRIYGACYNTISSMSVEGFETGYDIGTGTGGQAASSNLIHSMVSTAHTNVNCGDGAQNNVIFVEFRGDTNQTGVNFTSGSFSNNVWISTYPGTSVVSLFADVGSYNVIRYIDQTWASANLRFQSPVLLNALNAYGRLGQRLEINMSNNYGGIALNNWSAANQQPLLDFNKSRSATPGTMTVVQSQDNLGQIVFRGADGANFQDAAYIIGAVDGTPGANDMPGRLVFSTTPDGTATPVERLRIDNYGNIVIGTTNLPTTSTNGFLWLPTMFGPPTNAPSPSYSSRVCLVFDATNHQIYVYDGTWKKTAALT